MQTVDQFAASVKLKGACLLNDWAFDILEAYFRVVDQNAVVSRAEDRFRKIYYKKLDAEFNRLPFVKKQPDEGAAMHFTTLIETRKSVRSYIKGSVPPRKSIEEAVRLAALAPSSCNRQPFKFYVFEEEDVVESIARLAGGARSFAEGLPALAMLVGSTSVSPSPGDRHLMYIDGSLAAMNFMLALESMGISSCPINWPDNRKPEKALRKMVHLEPFERVVMLMAMGRAKDNSLVACSVRKEVEELVKFNPVKPSLKSN
jgi:nitroreductase